MTLLYYCMNTHNRHLFYYNLDPMSEGKAEKKKTKHGLNAQQYVYLTCFTGEMT